MRGEYQLSSYIKNYIFEKYNNKCARCGWSKMNPYTKNIPLEIEHIDGNYKNNIEEKWGVTTITPHRHFHKYVLP